MTCWPHNEGKMLLPVKGNLTWIDCPECNTIKDGVKNDRREKIRDHEAANS